jgi:hypothetical protein
VLIQACGFLRGTRILTPTGKVCIEDLRAGDLVVTRFSGLRPIKWIGRQTFDGRSLGETRDGLPVCIHAGALGPGIPARDLYISAGHSLLIDGQLILACLLVNGVTITQDYAPARAECFHIELISHDCVLAEGGWAETFADGPGRRDEFCNAAEFYALFPDHHAPERPVLCAARTICGPLLGAALEPIVARATTGLAPGHLRGFIDIAKPSGEITGWAHDEAHPDLPVLLQVFVDGVVIGAALAYAFRDDLRAAGFGRGRCSFRFTAGAPLTPAQLATLQIRRAADGADLPMVTECREMIELACAKRAAPNMPEFA